MKDDVAVKKDIIWTEIQIMTAEGHDQLSQYSDVHF